MPSYLVLALMNSLHWYQMPSTLHVMYPPLSWVTGSPIHRHDPHRPVDARPARHDMQNPLERRYSELPRFPSYLTLTYVRTLHWLLLSLCRRRNSASERMSPVRYTILRPRLLG